MKPDHKSMYCPPPTLTESAISFILSNAYEIYRYNCEYVPACFKVCPVLEKVLAAIGEHLSLASMYPSSVFSKRILKVSIVKCRVYKIY